MYHSCLVFVLEFSRLSVCNIYSTYWTTILAQKEIDGFYKHNDDKPKNCQSILKTSTIALYAQSTHMFRKLVAALGLLHAQFITPQLKCRKHTLTAKQYACTLFYWSSF